MYCKERVEFDSKSWRRLWTDLKKDSCVVGFGTGGSVDDACILAVLVEVLFESLAGSEMACNGLLLDSAEDRAAEGSETCIEIELVGTALSIKDVCVEIGATAVSIAPTVVAEWCSWDSTDGISLMFTSSASGLETLSSRLDVSNSFSILLEIEKLYGVKPPGIASRSEPDCTEAFEPSATTFVETLFEAPAVAFDD